MLDQNRLERFQESRDYRASYIASRVRLAIASQIRALREQFSGTQAEFSEKIGKPQSVVSRLENPDYGRMSVQTLTDIAEELDIALVVKFVSYDRFFTLLDDNQISPEALRVEPFADTVKLHEHIKTSSNVVSLGLMEKIYNGSDSIQSMRPPDHRTKETNTVMSREEEPAFQSRGYLLDSLSEDAKKGKVA